MSLWNYTVTFPAKILEGGSDERCNIEVQASDRKQAEKRALVIAVRERKITDANDWRWERRNVRLGWSR